MNQISAGLPSLPSLRVLWMYTYLLESRAFCSSGESEALCAGTTGIPARVTIKASNHQCNRIFQSPFLDIVGLLFRSGRNDSDRFDYHGFDWHIRVHAFAAGLHLLDLFHHIRSINDFAEHGVAYAILRFVAVEEVVVLGVDEELRGCAIWNRRTRYGERIGVIL